ncbi:MAG: formate hydrogenlyase [Gammaproteobacteria bacterium]|nr:formate hydrogenlyase [Gammaproteobacteria bacterium]
MELLQSIFSALILLTAFMLLLQTRIFSMITTFLWQSLLLALITFCQAYKLNAPELYISATMTICLKAIFVPILLKYFVRRLNIRHKVAVINHPFLLLIFAAGLVLFCYHLIRPLQAVSWVGSSNVIAVAMAVMLLGMLLLITHRKAICHVIGFMSMENGIFFGALVATNGMPMTVELGVAFDVLIAAILFGIFFLHLRSSIDSLDVDQMNLLREDVE